jgi:hypothetical protein
MNTPQVYDENIIIMFELKKRIKPLANYNIYCYVSYNIFRIIFL